MQIYSPPLEMFADTGYVHVCAYQIYLCEDLKWFHFRKRFIQNVNCVTHIRFCTKRYVTSSFSMERRNFKPTQQMS